MNRRPFSRFPLAAVFACLMLSTSVICQQVDDAVTVAPCASDADELAKNDGIDWVVDLKTAMARSVKESKPVFLVWNVRKFGNLLDPGA